MSTFWFVSVSFGAFGFLVLLCTRFFWVILRFYSSIPYTLPRHHPTMYSIASTTLYNIYFSSIKITPCAIYFNSEKLLHERNFLEFREFDLFLPQRLLCSREKFKITYLLKLISRNFAHIFQLPTFSTTYQVYPVKLRFFLQFFKFYEMYWNFVIFCIENCFVF